MLENLDEAEKQLKDERKRAKVKTKISKMYTRFQRASNAKGELVKRWQVIDMFDRGDQWKDSPLPPWMPKPSSNYIRYVRTMKRANLALNIPTSQFTPVTVEDREIVKDLQDAHDHVWEEQKVPLTIRRAIDRSILYGTQIAMVKFEDNPRGKYWEDSEMKAYNKMYNGDICVERIPVGRFFIDPDATRIQEAKYAEVTVPMPFSSVKEDPTYQKYAGDDLKKLTAIQLDMNADANGDIFKRDNMLSDSATMNQEEDRMVTVHIHFERYKKDGKWVLDVTHYLAHTDFLLCKMEDVKPSCYPFAILYDEEEENDFWGSSTAMDILENQKVVAKVQQSQANITALHQNPQKVVLRESGISPHELARTGTLAGKVYQSNMPNPIEIIPNPDIPSGSFELEDRMVQHIKDISGINEAYTGESVGSLTTSTGVNSLIDRATLRDRDKMVQINDFVEQISHLIVQMILVHWKEARPIMTQGENGEPQHGEFIPLGKGFPVENVEYRVKCDVYTKSPISQAQKQQQADKMMQLQGQFQFDPPIITPEEWIALQEYPNKYEILKRMEDDRVKKQQQETQNATQHLMQLFHQAQEMTAKGTAPQVIEQQINMQISQILESILSTGASQTAEGGQSVSAAGNSSAPSGTTGAAAMQAMASGN